LFAVQIEGDQAVGSEVDVDTLAVDGRRRASGVAHRVGFFQLFNGDGAPPQDVAILAGEAEHLQFRAVFLEGRKE
jgi:hypothetical protein